jgi:hypothetical protein
MKKLALLAAFLAVGAMAYGQGTFTMANKKGTTLDAPVLDASGAKLSGADYLAQLYAGPVGAGTFTAYGKPVPFKTGTAAGYFSDSTAVDVGVAAGTKVDVQVRAWRAAAGSSYEAAAGAAASLTGNYGASATIAGLATGGGFDANGIPVLPNNLIGLQGFSLTGGVVPEPSVLALGLLGAAVLVLRRRK